MKRNQTLFPLRYGRGTQKVSLYATTPALPYYRLAYRMGGKRLQRTVRSFEKAKEEAESFLARARGDIERERDNAIEEVRQQFANLAIAAAERVVERSLDRDAHREVFEKVLQESSKIGGNR